ncbi:MAG: PhzF family phenazine biosynthesis protein [Planctomycetes bacterium]|nr:PhzF family phenazine biosynthesis protein [Planctomycetota bacterium]
MGTLQKLDIGASTITKGPGTRQCAAIARARLHPVASTAMVPHRMSSRPQPPPNRAAPPRWLRIGRAVVAKAADDLLVELASEKQVRALQPDLAALGRLKVRGVIVTAAGDSRRHDFVSRFFGPAVGVPEDPVTGSAHCALAPYWGGRFGRTRMIGYQASARGGEVEVELVGDRVLLRGQAVTVVRGELLDGRRR